MDRGFYKPVQGRCVFLTASINGGRLLSSPALVGSDCIFHAFPFTVGALTSLTLSTATDPGVGSMCAGDSGTLLSGNNFSVLV